MPPPAPPAIGRSSQVLAVVLLGIQAALLAKALAAGDWILDAGGRPLFTDFSTIWVTGLQIRHEPAVAAYDWARHGAWERGWFATEGLPSGWHYAPSLLFVVWALALLPFPLAFAGWVASTGRSMRSPCRASSAIARRGSSRWRFRPSPGTPWWAKPAPSRRR